VYFSIFYWEITATYGYVAFPDCGTNTHT